MKNLFFTLLFSGALFSVSHAQLPDGTVAPNFTATDINGVQHNLYDLLNQGKTVYLEFSATWCSICWNYKNTHALKDLWNTYGPPGTNEAYVLFIESYQPSNTNCLYGSTGCNSSTQGNWVAGEPFPIIDDFTVGETYDVSYYPIIYCICPADKKLYQTGTQNVAGLWNVRATNCTSALQVTTANVQNVSCFGTSTGSIDITPSGGSSPYTYNWSNGAIVQDLNNIPAGTYTCTVTAANGTTAVTSAIAVSGPPSPLGIAQTNSTPMACNGTGATITVNASGGWSPYNYAWNNGQTGPTASGLSPGTYTVTATDIYGCSKVATLHTDALAIPSPSITTAPYTCTGTLTLESGGPYTSYLWQNGASGPSLEIFTAGTYTVTVTNENGCTGTASTDIAAIPERLQVLLNGPNRICAGSTAVISANEGFAGYAWSTGSQELQISVTEAGVYTVTATDAYNCTSTSQLQVALMELPDPQITFGPFNCNGFITLSTGTFAAYAWSNGSQTASVNAETSGIYTVTVTNDEGCTGIADVAVMIPELPDPQITTSAGFNYSVNVSVNIGYTSYLWSNGVQNPYFTTLESGLYTVTVTDVTGCTGTAEVTVQIEAEPLTTSSVSTEITCAGSNDGQLDVCPSGGVGPYTFTVTPAMPFQLTSTAECDNLFAVGNLPPGTYEWSVTDANGVSQSGSSIYTNPVPMVAGATVAGMTVTGSVTGGQPPYQYSIDGVNYQSDPVFADLPNGAYQVAVLDARGCTVLSPSVLVFVSGTDDIVADWQLQITPNPGNGDFRLRMNNCGADEVRLTIVDVAGRLIRQQVANTGGCNEFQYAIDLQDAAAGTYLVEVRTAFAVKTLPVVVIR